MRKAFIQFFKENQIARQAVAIALLLVYVALYCFASFSNFMSYSAIAMDDYSHNGLQDMAEEIIVVGVTDNDLEYFGECGSQIAAEVAQYVLKYANPAVVGLDIDASTIDDHAMTVIDHNVKGYSKLVVPSIVMFDNLPFIDDFDEASDGIVSDGIVSLFNANYQGHTVRLLDENGVLRHAVFDIEDKNGKVVKSLAEVCYEVYCTRIGVEMKDQKMSSQNTSLVKMAVNSEITYSAKDILQGKIPSSFLNKKIVLIGYAHEGLERGYITAVDYQAEMYPVLFDANVINNLLQGELVVSISNKVQVILLAAAILLLAFVVSRTGLFPSICSVAAYELAIQLGAIMLYRIGYVAYLLPHMINGVLSFVIFLLVSFFVNSARRKEELEALLGRYVDISIVKNLSGRKQSEKKKDDISDAKKEKAAVMFADIRRFTSLSENVDATSLFNILNDYLSMMADCINKYGGTVDKFIGDCAMGYWLVKGAEYDPAYRACLAAEEIQRKAKDLSKKYSEKYGFNIEVGIGISYGETVIGNVGSIKRSNYTIVGDTVNIASRLEGIAPAGEIYLSSEVVESVGAKIECESIGEDVSLKNKTEKVEVYKLLNIAPISVRSRSDKKNEEEIEKYKTRAIALIAAGICGFFVDFVFAMNTMRELEIKYFLYYSVGLTVAGGLCLIFIVSRFIKEFNEASIRKTTPHWVSMLLLTTISLHIQVPLYRITTELLSAGTVMDYPGTGFTYIVNPIMLTGFWILFSSGIKYKFYDFIVAPVILLLTIAFNNVICRAQGLNELYADVYSVSYDYRALMLSIILNVIILIVAYQIHKRVRIERIAKLSEKSILHKFIVSASKPGKERESSGIAQIILNVLIAALSIRVTYRSFIAGGVDVYSNPSVIGILVTVMCILSIIYNLQSIFNPVSANHNRWYKYVSFMKMLGCVINFLTILFLALSGEGFHIFFEEKWFGDWTVYVLCPIITLIMWLIERNNYGTGFCALCAVPYALIVPLSKFALESAAVLEEYAYEVENFYSTSEMIVIMVGEIVYAIALCFLGRVVSKIFSKQTKEAEKIVMSVCGNRRGIVGGEGKNHEYGTHSECYVIRTGDYGIVINAGSGLINASERLYGCTEVDILLTSNEFSMVMGFLAVRDICPKARIKIYSPYSISAIAAKPYWPANVVKGIFERVRVSRPIRLNNEYSVEFEYANKEKTNCMLKLTGLATICYTGKLGNNSVDLAKWAQDADLLIYDAYNDAFEGCYLAIDCNAAYLVLSGFRPDVDDEKLAVIDEEVQKIIEDVSLGKEREDYFVYH